MPESFNISHLPLDCRNITSGWTSGWSTWVYQYQSSPICFCFYRYERWSCPKLSNLGCLILECRLSFEIYSPIMLQDYELNWFSFVFDHFYCSKIIAHDIVMMNGILLIYMISVVSMTFPCSTRILSGYSFWSFLYCFLLVIRGLGPLWLLVCLFLWLGSSELGLLLCIWCSL